MGEVKEGMKEERELRDIFVGGEERERERNAVAEGRR